MLYLGSGPGKPLNPPEFAPLTVLSHEPRRYYQRQRARRTNRPPGRNTRYISSSEEAGAGQRSPMMAVCRPSARTGELKGYQIRKFLDLTRNSHSRTAMMAKSFALAKDFCSLVRKFFRDHEKSSTRYPRRVSIPGRESPHSDLADR